MFGLYIHIPFCKSRCVYCDFASSTLGEQWQSQYLDALECEMQIRQKEMGTTRVRTIYIGGGTPSQLTPSNLQHLFCLIQRYYTWDEIEITLEANPDDITEDFISSLKDTPVNRISMGLQSTNNEVLRFLRRRHTAEQAEEAVRSLQRNGYENLSLDLIYGLPRQSLQQFERDVQRVLALGVPHLSAYALQFEEGTALWKLKEQGCVQEADEELSLQCYERLIDLTAEAGMEHYEISNFARTGFHSRHNSSYWQGLPYIGLGAGAHSYDGIAMRRANTADVKEYIAHAESRNLKFEVETLTTEELYDERIMLSLRTKQGIDLGALKQDFGDERLHECLQAAQPHIQRGTLTHDNDHLRLTRKGLFISDSIIVDLFQSKDLKDL